MASTARLDELKKKFDENPRRYFAPLANELRKSGDVEQAIALCRTHLPQQPAHISGHIVLGQALFEAGQLDESRETFHTALELDPENLIALRYLGDIARTGGDVPTARSWYQRVLEVDPRNEEIVQLVRDLDAPPSESAPTQLAPASAGGASAVHPSTPAPAAAEAPAATAPDDSRFAPLDIDQVDADTELFVPSNESTETASAATESFDAHAAWNAESPTVEMPMLDVPELDPFDMAPSGTAQSLFDATTSSGADHAGFFLDELSTPNDPVDIGDLDAAPTEPVTHARESTDGLDVHGFEARPDVQEVAAPTANASAPDFEEGSFYLEPPPATPAWSEPVIAEHAPADQAAESASPAPSAAGGPQGETPLQDAEGWKLDASVAAADAPNVPVAEVDFDHVDAALDAAPAASYEAPVAETMHAEPAAAMPAAVDDGLGLEVMEFVPPTSSAAPSLPTSQVAADPLVGHMPELTAPSMGVRPDAFVTETMAELYLQQGFRNEALAVYHELLARNPSDTSLRERIEQIESGSMSSLGMATLSENVVESARKRQTERPTRSVRSFFASLAGRRAPQPPPSEVETAAYDATYEATYDSGASEPSTTAESPQWSTEPPAPASEPQAPYATDAEPEYAQPDSVIPPTEAPQSAAEQMATFDPFADAWDAPASRPGAPNEAPAIEATSVQPTAEQPFENPAPDAMPASAATPAAEARPAARSLEDLFPESSPTPRADAAATTLATAFGRTEPQGRPTRAASNELSLDRVFRGAPEGTPPSDGGFSFDQFFSDSRTPGGDATAAPVTSNAPEGTSDSESGDSHDIEQFTAWLEGLKKK